MTSLMMTLTWIALVTDPEMEFDDPDLAPGTSKYSYT